MAKLLPLEKLALEVGGWGVLALLAFFFHPIGLCVILLILASKADMFMFVHANTKDVTDDPEPKQNFEQLHFPGLSRAELGSYGEGSVRKNLSEGEAERRTGDVG